jgi:hypothetical protein
MSGKKLLLLTLGAFAVLFVGGFFLWNEATKADLAAAQQRLRDAGLPMTVDDIRPAPVPDADNAALLIAKIKPMIDALPPVAGENFNEWFADFQSQHNKYRLNVATAKELADQLDSLSLQAVLALCREAAGKTGFNSNVDYSKGLNILFPEVDPMQKAAKMLRWQARLMAFRGQTDAASAEIYNEANLADLISHEPGLIPMLVSVTIWTMVTDDLELLAATGGIPLDWNEKFAKRLSALKANAGLASAFDTERVTFGGVAFQTIIDGSTKDLDFLAGGDLKGGGVAATRCLPYLRHSSNGLCQLS